MQGIVHPELMYHIQHAYKYIRAYDGKAATQLLLHILMYVLRPTFCPHKTKPQKGCKLLLIFVEKKAIFVPESLKEFPLCGEAAFYRIEQTFPTLSIIFFLFHFLSTLTSSSSLLHSLVYSQFELSLLYMHTHIPTNQLPAAYY